MNEFMNYDDFFKMMTTDNVLVQKWEEILTEGFLNFNMPKNFRSQLIGERNEAMNNPSPSSQKYKYRKKIKNWKFLGLEIRN